MAKMSADSQKIWAENLAGGGDRTNYPVSQRTVRELLQETANSEEQDAGWDREDIREICQLMNECLKRKIDDN